MEAYRILSLDSGGVWALLQVMALRRIFGPQARGHQVLRWFNLAAASGSGSIVLAGLAMDMTLQEILDSFFVDKSKREAFFGKPRVGWFKKSAPIVRLEALKDVLGVKNHKGTLGALVRRVRATAEVGPQFLICALDCDRRRPEFFRSDNDSPSASSTISWDPPLVDMPVPLAQAAAT